MDESGFEIQEIAFSKSILINYPLKGKSSRFNSLHDLFQLPTPDLEQKLDKLKLKGLDYDSINHPKVKGSTDYGRESLALNKKIDGKTLRLEIRNWGMGTPNEVGEIQATIEAPEDLVTINLMLKELFAIFDNTAPESETGNRIREELGADFQFKLPVKQNK